MSNIHSLNTDDDKPPRRGSNSGSESSDDEDRQGFFVGGSTHSGQEVLGPNRQDADARLFEAIQRAGAERLTPEQLEEQQRRANNERSGGGGFRLGGHGVSTEQVGGSTSAARSAATAQQRPQQVVRMYIWTNGFSLDDGPLRQFNDPQNRSFMQALTLKRVPPELMSLYPGREVDLRIEKKGTEYVPPKMKPFSGQGQRLGSLTPGMATASNNEIECVDLEAPSPVRKPEDDAVKTAQEEVGLDESKPVTRVQIRFPDVPQPIVARFNHNHFVYQIRAFIATAQPSLGFRPFQLMTVYPRRVLDEEKQSLKDAGLLNAAITIKFDS